MLMKRSLRKLIAGTPLERPARYARGFFVANREWYLRAQRDERDVNRILSERLRVDSVCIDIGANEGAFLSKFMKLAPEGRHHAFEPIPYLATELRQRFPTVEVHAFALASSSGSAIFHHVLDLRSTASEQISTIYRRRWFEHRAELERKLLAITL